MLKDDEIRFSHVNALFALMQACDEYNVRISKIQYVENGFRVEFAGFPYADAIAHEGSYGAVKNNYQDSVSDWETIGFPWDCDDVTVHTARALAAMIAAIKNGDNWEKYEDLE